MFELTRRAAAEIPARIFFAISITHRKDAVYPATIVGLPPMEDFYMAARA